MIPPGLECTARYRHAQVKEAKSKHLTVVGTVELSAGELLKGDEFFFRFFSCFFATCSSLGFIVPCSLFTWDVHQLSYSTFSSIIPILLIPTPCSSFQLQPSPFALAAILLQKALSQVASVLY